jgi:hypothetical protein
MARRSFSDRPAASKSSSPLPDIVCGRKKEKKKQRNHEKKLNRRSSLGRVYGTEKNLGVTRAKKAQHTCILLKIHQQDSER